MSNRAQRRARGKSTQLVGFKLMLTPGECEIVEEALDAYRRQMVEDLDGLELTDLQVWALERAEVIQNALAAAVQNRPWHDSLAVDREPPVTEL